MMVVACGRARRVAGLQHIARKDKRHNKATFRC